MAMHSVIVLILSCAIHARQHQFLVTEVFGDSKCETDPLFATDIWPIGGCQGEDVDGDFVMDRINMVEANGSHAVYKACNCSGDPNLVRSGILTCCRGIPDRMEVRDMRCHNVSNSWRAMRVVTLDSFVLEVYTFENCSFSHSAALSPLHFCRSLSDSSSAMVLCNGNGIQFDQYPNSRNCAGSEDETAFYPAVTSGPCAKGTTMVPKSDCLPPSTVKRSNTQHVCTSTTSSPTSPPASVNITKTSNLTLPRTDALVLTSASLQRCLPTVCMGLAWLLQAAGAA